MPSISPAVSVIVTSYNYGKYLDDALACIQAQSFEDWECIIVDDGSQDDTPHIARGWADRDSRFTYLRQENAGLSAARNAGLSQARGRYIQILDADDTIQREKFDVQVKLLGTLPEDSLVYSSYELVYDPSDSPRIQRPPLRARRPILTSLILDWERNFSIPPHCFMFRRSHFGTAGTFDVDLPTHEDIDLYLKLAAGGVAFHHHGDVLAGYRRHDANMSASRARMNKGYLLALGRAAQRASSRHEQLLMTYRYLMEFERSLTDWVIRRYGAAEAREILCNEHRLLAALGILFYPYMACRRLIEITGRLLARRFPVRRSLTA